MASIFDSIGSSLSGLFGGGGYNIADHAAMAQNILDGGDPLEAMRKKRQEEQDRQDQLKKLLAAQMAMGQPVSVSAPPMQRMGGGLSSLFGG